MAVTSAQTLITDLARRMGYDSASSTVRVDMLRRLNNQYQEICRDHSLSFLATYGTMSLISGTTELAVPAGIDTGKAMTLGRADGKGEIEYVAIDDWFRTRIDTYAAPTQTEPSYFTIAKVSSTLTFLFKAGASGGNKTIPYIAQVFVTALADSGSSFPLLPEGFENTLLLKDAEAEERRIANEPQWEVLKAEANEVKERLYAMYRTTKDQPVPDREVKERKMSREVLAEGK